MNAPVDQVDILGTVELLGSIADLCSAEAAKVSAAMERFAGTDGFGADGLRDEVIAYADVLAKALGFADWTMGADR